LIVAGAAGPHEAAANILGRFGLNDIEDSPNVDQAIEALRRVHYDLIILPLQDITQLQLAALDREIRRGRFTFIIGTAPKSDPDLILRAMRAGIHEFLVYPPDPTELAAAVDRLMRRNPSDGKRGEVYAVFNSKGGLGTTTIAVNLAAAFARNNPQARVALVDLVVEGGDVRVFLNLRPAYHLGDLIEKLDRVDADLLYSLLTPREGGVWVLPGPDSPEFDDLLDSQTITTMIEHLRSHFAFTVLDCEHHMSERTVSALDLADRILLVTQLTVPALRSVQRSLSLFRTRKCVSSSTAFTPRVARAPAKCCRSRMPRMSSNSRSASRCPTIIASRRRR
jgi:pilus assembly protein CpaE